MSNNKGTASWELEQLENASPNLVLSETIRQTIVPVEASFRVQSAPDSGTFKVFGIAPSLAVVVQADEDGMPTVSSQALLATFGDKQSAFEFAALVNQHLDGDKNAWGKITQYSSNIATGAIDSIDSFTAALVDPHSPANTGIGNSISDFANSSLLETLLTSNSPTINIPMVLEEICEFIISDPTTDINASLWDQFWEKVNQLVGVLIREAIKKIKVTIAQVLGNISNKTRQMVAGKLNEFLAEYAADACVGGLAEAIANFQNPKNLLSLNELFGSIGDVFEELDKSVGTIFDEIHTIFQTVITTFDKAFSPTERAKFFEDKFAEILTYLNRAICGRTKAFIEMAEGGFKKGLEDEIKNFMQGCLFQQALKTAQKIAPESMATDVLNRVSNLAQKGQMMDAYNIALAAGFDLQSSAFQIELPYAGSWVSDVYGDPYMFSPSRPFNSAQVAQYALEGIPTFNEMMSGEIPADKLAQPWVSNVWSAEDSEAMAAHNMLSDKTSQNQASILGAELQSKSVSYPGTALKKDEHGVTVISTNGVPITETNTVSSPVVKNQPRND